VFFVVVRLPVFKAFSVLITYIALYQHSTFERAREPIKRYRDFW